jgi:hypothetical protein
MSEDVGERVARILMPYAHRKLDEVREHGTRFVQYTTAEAALAILTKREVWMRNASCMNDYSETRYGLQRVLEAYASPPGQRFQAALNAIHGGLTDDLKARFDPFTPSMLSHTYLACFSEHRDDEDEHGRLSMWRAYGGATGVAIVMNNHPFVTPSDALNAWTSPVAYIRGIEFIQELDAIASDLETNVDWLRSIPRENLVEAVLRMLVFAAVSIKHIGFEEEREWRVVYLPNLVASARLIEDHLAIRGVPQPVFKIPLMNYPEHGFTGAEPHELINRIIIGPTQYPIAVRSSLLARLYELEVANPQEKVVISGIPLRC